MTIVDLWLCRILIASSGHTAVNHGNW